MTTKIILGDALRLYNTLLPYIQWCFWNDVRNARTCIWMLVGLILSGCANPATWVPYFPKGPLAASIERKMTRLLKNGNIDYVNIYGPLVVKALKSWGNHSLRIALDTSMLFNEFCLIRISILFRGRGIPLVTRVIEHNSAMVSSEILKPIIADAHGMLSAAGISDITFLADRGFGDVELFKLLDACRWKYIIRIKGNSLLYTNKKHRLCNVGGMALRQGEAKCLQNVWITGKKYGPVHVAVARSRLSREKWMIVSNEPISVESFGEYGTQFQIEEGFLDEKSGLFQLEQSRFRNAGALERLSLILSLGTLFLTSEGVECVASGDRRLVDAHWKRVLSYLKIGLRRVWQAVSWGEQVFQELKLVGGVDDAPTRHFRRKTDGPSHGINDVWNMKFRIAS